MQPKKNYDSLNMKSLYKEVLSAMQTVKKAQINFVCSRIFLLLHLNW